MGEMEGIVHIRIDDRFLHGQVVGMWTNTVKATRIMVPNDRVAADDMLKKVLRMAAPAGVKTSIIPVERAAKQILEGRYAGQRVFMVVENPVDILRLMDYGLPIKHVNVGNIGGREDRIQVKTSLCMSPEEAKMFREMMDRGVEVTSQMVPSEALTHLSDFMDEKGL